MSIAIDADFAMEPFLHQLREFERHAETRARALIWQMRTGKSKAVVDMACHLWRRGLVDAVMVFAPNGVHENWALVEVPTHVWPGQRHRRWAWRTGEDNPTLVKELLRDKDALAWACFSAATMSRVDARREIARVTRNRRRILCVFDESDDYRTPGSRRSRQARGIAGKCAYRRILSGTVVHNSPLHAWAQYELLEPGALGYATYTAMERGVAIKEDKYGPGGRRYPAVVGYRRLGQLAMAMAGYSSIVTRDECDDLPDLVVVQHGFDLTPEESTAYDTLARKGSRTADVMGEPVHIGDVAPKAQKLRQIVSGFLRGGDRADRVMPSGRAAAFTAVVSRVSGRMIAWCQYRRDVVAAAAILRGLGREVLEYHGGTSAADKMKARAAMAPETGDVGPDLVGQPQAGGRGLNLSAAGTIVWYSHTFDAIVRAQADERATLVGGQNVRVIELVAPVVDPHVLSETAAKRSVADDIEAHMLGKLA